MGPVLHGHEADTHYSCFYRGRGAFTQFCYIRPTFYRITPVCQHNPRLLFSPRSCIAQMCSQPFPPMLPDVSTAHLDSQNIIGRSIVAALECDMVYPSSAIPVSWHGHGSLQLILEGAHGGRYVKSCSVSRRSGLFSCLLVKDTSLSLSLSMMTLCSWPSKVGSSWLGCVSVPLNHSTEQRSVVLVFFDPGLQIMINLLGFFPTLRCTRTFIGNRHSTTCRMLRSTKIRSTPRRIPTRIILTHPI